jgi:hypothetical protein
MTPLADIAIVFSWNGGDGRKAPEAGMFCLMTYLRVIVMKWPGF